MAQTCSSCHDKGVHAQNFLKKKVASDCRKDLSLSPNLSLLEHSQLGPTTVLGKVYNKVSCEPLRDPHLRKSKMLKECKFKFVGLDRVMTKTGVVEKRRKPQNRGSVFVVRGVDS